MLRPVLLSLVALLAARGALAQPLAPAEPRPSPASSSSNAEGDGPGEPAATPAGDIVTSRTAPATRARREPVIDGRDDDPIWRSTPVIERFRQYSPREDGDASFRTAARVAYDDRNLYVFIRAYDPHPDSVRRFLARRDERAGSDEVRILLDSYHDRRTGYEFIVSAAGVKRDQAITNDGEENPSWDAVWDAAVRVDSLGWTAEMRIPLSQLRFAREDANTFGVAFQRDIPRLGERDAWPAYHPSHAGLASQFGDLAGITLGGAPRRLEVTPYVVSQNRSLVLSRAPDVAERAQSARVGTDVKYGLTSNLTVDATINPDFGQVEADPAVLNLSGFETYYPEQRPFFMEGSGILRFDLSCGGCGLFYSRRIGRAPQLAGYEGYSDASTPRSSTILGATKLTGRTAGGLSVGVLDAMTERVAGPSDLTVEPATNYGIVRLQQDLQDGRTGLGVMVTGVERSLDATSSPFLRRDAYTGGADFRHRFAADRFEIGGYVAASRVDGSAAAIDSTQKSSTHDLQRPDARLGFDPTRTSLTGDAEQVGVSKIAGVTRFSLGYQRLSRGFEPNDAGYLQRADRQSESNWFGLRFTEPSSWYRKLSVNASESQSFNTAGMLQGVSVATSGWGQLPNYESFSFSAGVGQLGGALGDDIARGGPAVRRSPSRSASIGWGADNRRAWQLGFYAGGWRGDYGRSAGWSVGPTLDGRAGSQLRVSLSPSLSVDEDDSQWYGNSTTTDSATGDATTHYTFAHLDARTLSVSTRLSYTLSPTLSLQLYAQPFVSRGAYSHLRELADPRNPDYDRRFRDYPYDSTSAAPVVTPTPLGGVDYTSFRSNTVLRWEYRPGSTLFLVWTQGRSFDDGAASALQLGPAARGIFGLRPDNTFLIKASYWLGA